MVLHNEDLPAIRAALNEQCQCIKTLDKQLVETSEQIEKVYGYPGGGGAYSYPGGGGAYSYPGGGGAYSYPGGGGAYSYPGGGRGIQLSCSHRLINHTYALLAMYNSAYLCECVFVHVKSHFLGRR